VNYSGTVVDQTTLNDKKIATIDNTVVPSTPATCVGDCTTHNPLTPTATVAKSVTKKLPDGTQEDWHGLTVAPGDELTWTLTVQNTGSVVIPSGTLFTDDVSEAIAGTDLVNVQAAFSASSAGVSLAYDTTSHELTGSAANLAVGDSVTVTYTGTVADQSVLNGPPAITTIDNTVIPAGPVVCDPAGVCTTHNPLRPAWTVQKNVDKAVAHPGDTLTYTLTATNIGSLDVTGAIAADTLPANVTVVDTAASPLNPALTLSADGKTLTWKVSDLQAPSGSMTASYQVTVNDDAAGTTQTNLIVPSTPGGECVGNDPANCTTLTDIPAWTLEKSSNPADGSQVNPGSTIEYTLTVTNNGPGELSDATVTDDLSGVLNHATFAAGSIKASGTGSATLTGTDLAWNVPDKLAVGGVATVSYQVRVNSGAYNVTLHNVATPGDPGGTCLDNDPDNCETTHRTPGPPSVSPSFATPAYSLDQCILGTGNAKVLTVSSVARTGVSYTITGNGSAAVTITATANGGYDLNVPSGWSGNTSRASITVRATDSTLCVGGESSSVPPSTRTAVVVPSATDNVQVLPTHRDEVGSIAYTGVNTIGMSALAMLLLGVGVLLLWFGLAVRREQREH
jgi:uncharacterized repeat protein (TIGR01451 family)/fimbrial isopeptide formation D2 family protein